MHALLKNTMSKSCVALLAAYLLDRKTNLKLFPHAGAVKLQRAFAERCTQPLEPIYENIKLRPTETSLYGKPDEPEKQLKKRLKEPPLGEKDLQQTWPFHANWDGMERKNKQKFEKWRWRYLYFHAAPESDENFELTERGVAQAVAIKKKIKANRSSKGNKDSFDHFSVSFEPKCRAILQVRAFEQMQSNKSVEDPVEQWLVDGFPVDRMDPPHSDIMVPRNRNAEADMWGMEYAFRTVCKSAKRDRGKAGDVNSHEHYVLPKNLIAYFVQRAMQFEPGVFGRLRISDGSFTRVDVSEDGEVYVHVMAETSHLVKEYEKQKLCNDAPEDSGMDAPEGPAAAEEGDRDEGCPDDEVEEVDDDDEFNENCGDQQQGDGDAAGSKNFKLF